MHSPVDVCPQSGTVLLVRNTNAPKGPKMKKFLTLTAVAMIAAVSLSACSSSDNPAEPLISIEESTETEADIAAVESENELSSDPAVIFTADVAKIVEHVKLEIEAGAPFTQADIDRVLSEEGAELMTPDFAAVVGADSVTFTGTQGSLNCSYTSDLAAENEISAAACNA